MKKQSLLIFILLLTRFVGNAQDINFSQFYETPMLRNPALAGIFVGDIRVTSAFRSQWQQVTTPYQTSALGVETKFSVSEYSNDFYSIGVQVTNDVAGDSRMGKTQVLPSFTYHKFIREENNLFLSAGFIGGLVQQRFDPSKLRMGDQFVNGAYSSANPTRQTFNNTNVTYWDLSAGMALSGQLTDQSKFYIGAAYSHFTQPKVAFDKNRDVRLNRKITINAGASIVTSEYDQVLLYADYFHQGGNNLLQGGFLYKHKLWEVDDDMGLAFGLGAFLRWNDAAMPVAKLDYMKWSLGYTYDVNISKLKTASQLRGGSEITLSFKSFLNIRNTSAQKMSCPIL